MPELINGREFMRVSEYAHYRGVSQSSISNAIKRGKIYKHLNGLIDVQQTDAMYTPTGQTPLNGRRPADLARMVEKAPPGKGYARGTNHMRKSADQKNLAIIMGGNETGRSSDLTDDELEDEEFALSRAAKQHGTKSTEEIYIRARAEREVLRMESEQIKLAQLKGEVISMAEVEKQVAKISKHNRDAWLNWPDDVAVAMAAKIGCDPKLLRDELFAAVRHNLNTIANMAFDDITDPA